MNDSEVNKCTLTSIWDTNSVPKGLQSYIWNNALEKNATTVTGWQQQKKGHIYDNDFRTIQIQRLLWKVNGQKRLVEGFTLESDNSKFERYCSIIFLCVSLFSHSQLQKLTQFQHSSPSNWQGSRKHPNDSIHYSTLSLFLHSIGFLCGVGGWWDERQKVSDNTEGIRMHSGHTQLQHLEKTSSFYDTLKLQQTVTPRPE